MRNNVFWVTLVALFLGATWLQAQPVVREYIVKRTGSDTTTDVFEVKSVGVGSSGSFEVTAASVTVAGFTEVMLANTSATIDVYCGELTGVTSATGFPVEAGSKLTLAVSQFVDVYCIAASGAGADIRVLSVK